MIEVLWHGRGGQGAFTAARLLGAAASLGDESFSLAFPSFGPERRGAPIRAFTKIDNAPIGDRSAIEKADLVIYLDRTLFSDVWEEDLKPNGIVLINSPQKYEDPRIISIDADEISTKILGRAIPNTAFLGAIVAINNKVQLENMKEAVRQYMAPKLHDSNIAIIDNAYNRVSRMYQPGNSSSDSVDNAPAEADINASGTHNAKTIDPADIDCAVASPTTDIDSLAVKSTANSQENPNESKPSAAYTTTDRPNSSSLKIPTLRSDNLHPKEYAQNTCFEAGFLTSKNAGWRNIKPVIDTAKCTGCLQCYLYCPDGAIFKTAQTVQADATTQPLQTTQTDASVAIDYDFCKGCGVCATVCKFDSIKMIPESEAIDD